MDNMNKPLITKKDLIGVNLRGYGETSTLNYERFEALALVWILAPILKKLYVTKEDRVRALKRHLEFYNSNGWGNPPIYGTIIALEEKNAMGIDVEDSINSIKVGLMGPFAGIGDSLIGATFRPLLSGITAAIALQTESILGAILFLVIYNGLQISWRWWSLNYGYKFGTNMLKDIKETNILQKITEGSAIMGLMVLGVLIFEWVPIKTGINFVSGPKEMSLQDILNGIMPGLLPLLATMGISWLLRKKFSALKVIGCIFVFAFVIAIMNHFLGIQILVS